MCMRAKEYYNRISGDVASNVINVDMLANTTMAVVRAVTIRLVFACRCPCTNMVNVSGFISRSTIFYHNAQK
jgi:hypothetical protein